MNKFLAFEWYQNRQDIPTQTWLIRWNTARLPTAPVQISGLPSPSAILWSDNVFNPCGYWYNIIQNHFIIHKSNNLFKTIFYKIIEGENYDFRPAGELDKIMIWKLCHSKAMKFKIFFVIYFMFRKVTVFSLQGGWEERWKREADDPVMTHVVQNLCPGGYCQMVP